MGNSSLGGTGTVGVIVAIIVVLALVLIAIGLIKKRTPLPQKHQIILDAIIQSNLTKTAQKINFEGGYMTVLYQDGKVQYECYLPEANEPFSSSSATCEFKELKSYLDFDSMLEKFEKGLKVALEDKSKDTIKKPKPR